MKSINCLFAAILLLLATVAQAGALPGQHSNECGDLSAESFSTSNNGFSHPPGIFDGDWAGKLSQTVVLLKAENGRAFTMYAYGTYEKWGIDEPYCFSIPGKIKSSDKIVLNEFYDGAVVSYEFDGPNTIHGTHKKNGRVTRGTFTRVYTPPHLEDSDVSMKE